MGSKTLGIALVGLLLGIAVTIAASQTVSILDNAISEYCQNREYE